MNRFWAFNYFTQCTELKEIKGRHRHCTFCWLCAKSRLSKSRTALQEASVPVSVCTIVFCCYGSNPKPDCDFTISIQGTVLQTMVAGSLVSWFWERSCGKTWLSLLMLLDPELITRTNGHQEECAADELKKLFTSPKISIQWKARRVIGSIILQRLLFLKDIRDLNCYRINIFVRANVINCKRNWQL